MFDVNLECFRGPCPRHPEFLPHFAFPALNHLTCQTVHLSAVTDASGLFSECVSCPAEYPVLSLFKHLPIVNQPAVSRRCSRSALHGSHETFASLRAPTSVCFKPKHERNLMTLGRVLPMVLLLRWSCPLHSQG